MGVSIYDLLQTVAPFTEKEDTHVRWQCSSQKLSARLHFLPTGQSLEDLEFTTEIAPQTLSRIISFFMFLPRQLQVKR
jgi:hypothetical protein